MEFSDRDSIKAWLAGKSPQVQTAFAARSALRAVPALGYERFERDGKLLLACFLAAIVSSVAAIRPSRDLRMAGDFAHDHTDDRAGLAADFEPFLKNLHRTAADLAVTQAAWAATGSVSFAWKHTGGGSEDAAFRLVQSSERAAEFAALDTGDARRIALAALEKDAEYLDAKGTKVFEEPLWSDAGIPHYFEAPYRMLLDFWEEDSRAWAFWKRWYEGMLAGMPMAWDLQEKIALINPAVWKAGPEAVAEKIGEIEGDYRTRVAPRLVRDDSAGKFRVEDDPLPPAETSEFVCETIEISLRTALEGSGANGFDENSPEAIQIRGTLDAPTKSVSVLAVGFYQACLSFNDRIGDIYPEDASLINLKNALWTATEELSELDEEARARCARLAALQIKREVDPPDREMIAGVTDIVSDELDAEAREIVESDVERILTEQKPSKFVRARFTNWMSTISNWMDKGMKADKRAKWLSDLVSRLRDWWSDTPES